MGNRKLLFVLLLALLPFIGWAQQKNYAGQHVSIKQTTGDSIQYDIGMSTGGFKPNIKDGKIVWSFQDRYEFTIESVESVDFRSFEYDERESRKALIEFYQAMDGDNWPESYKTNWCSDRPIWEWAGVNNLHSNLFPWVADINIQGIESLSPRQIPDCISRMGPINFCWLSDNNFNGCIPDFFGNNYSLIDLTLTSNKLTGPFPKSMENLGRMPSFSTLNLELNSFEGTLPEELIVPLMDKLDGLNLRLDRNYYSGKVPESISNHSKFRDFWPSLLIQEKGDIDLSELTIPAPVFSFKDVNGNTISLDEIYKNNKYTLLYKWGWWCPWSELYNQLLIPAYLGYKEKGLEIIGLHIAQDMEKEEVELKEYVKNHSIPWNNVLFGEWNYVDGRVKDETAVINWTLTTPELLLVDQNGNVVFSSYMDEKGKYQAGTLYRNQLFSYLEEHLGKIDYNFYTSTDYSKDGEVSTFQTATIGQGIDLVFVGEAFTDKDLEEGVFDQRMTEALDQFFKFEPYSSLRDRFNVYAVKAVSANAEFFGNATHAIDEDVSKALEYASKVTTLIPNRPMHVIVVYNNSNGKRSYCNMMEDNSFVCFSMDGVSNILNHEAGGHGIGKLFDEYVEQGNESLSLPDENKNELENQWTTLGWGANVDWRSDPTEVKWSKFISDARYADEKIGVYEGSYLYQFGAYRPTENSMMRYNDIPFNAPSREEIYKRVMKESEGDSWIYDYETFVAFDAAGHAQFVNSLKSNARTRGEELPKVKPLQRTAPPVFMKGTWRDALKGNKAKK
jgi:hypothetical protein